MPWGDGAHVHDEVAGHILRRSGRGPPAIALQGRFMVVARARLSREASWSRSRPAARG